MLFMEVTGTQNTVRITRNIPVHCGSTENILCSYNSWHQLYQLNYEESNKKIHADFHEVGIIYKSVAKV
jgi:hypothetical protein